jgi:hypothetical protein
MSAAVGRTTRQTSRAKGIKLLNDEVPTTIGKTRTTQTNDSKCKTAHVPQDNIVAEQVSPTPTQDPKAQPLQRTFAELSTQVTESDIDPPPPPPPTFVDQGTLAMEPDFNTLDPVEFEICQKYFIAVQCGKKEALDSLFELSLTKASIVARIIVVICYADNEVKLLPKDTTLMQHFRKSTVEWLQLHHRHQKPVIAAYCSYYLAEYNMHGIYMDTNPTQAAALLAAAQLYLALCSNLVAAISLVME